MKNIIFVFLYLLLFSSGKFLFSAEKISGEQFSNQVLIELNYARQNPAEYCNFLIELRKMYQGKYIKKSNILLVTREGVKAVDEAIVYMKHVKPLPTLQLSQGLSLAALDHVIQQGQAGDTGHQGIDGKSPEQRIQKYGTWLKEMGENITYGSETPRDVVLDLIIDDGVPSRGHRKNIFNPAFKVTGIAYGPHTHFGSICVITFAGGFQRK